MVPKPLKLLYTDFSIIIGSVYLFLPLMIVTVAGVMENIDDEMMEAALSLGAARMEAVMTVSYTHSMGVDIKAFRLALILVSSILSACVTAFAGPVSFVGIAVPQLVKSLFKTTKPVIMIPACFLGGAVFCSFCDRIARTLFSPVELSISTVTAVFGAPVVIYMMVQGKGRRR